LARITATPKVGSDGRGIQDDFKVVSVSLDVRLMDGEAGRSVDESGWVGVLAEHDPLLAAGLGRPLAGNAARV
jgi:hypothetical protein